MQFDGEELTFRRVFNYVFGLYLITLGVAFSIKSGLGSAPVSSIPYAIDLIWLINIGVATFIFHAILVFIEWILLRDDFKRKHFLQVFVGVLFGVFTSFSVSLMNFIPPADSFSLALLMSFFFSANHCSGTFFLCSDKSDSAFGGRRYSSYCNSHRQAIFKNKSLLGYFNCKYRFGFELWIFRPTRKCRYWNNYWSIINRHNSKIHS